MYNHNKAQQSKNRVHISWDILYIIIAPWNLHLPTAMPWGNIVNTLQWRHDAMASQITSPTIVSSAVHSGADDETSKLRGTGLCAGNSPVTGEFPTQRASNAEYVSIWWRHHEHSKHAMQCGTSVILESISGICYESLATRLFVQQHIQTKKKTKFKIQDLPSAFLPVRETTGYRWFPLTKDPECWKRFLVMAS